MKVNTAGCDFSESSDDSSELFENGEKLKDFQKLFIYLKFLLTLYQVCNHNIFISTCQNLNQIKISQCIFLITPQHFSSTFIFSSTLILHFTMRPIRRFLFPLQPKKTKVRVLSAKRRPKMESQQGLPCHRLCIIVIKVVANTFFFSFLFSHVSKKCTKKTKKKSRAVIMPKGRGRSEKRGREKSHIHIVT